MFISLSQPYNFKTVGSAASSFQGESASRDSFVLSQARTMSTKPQVEVHASTKEGWLRSKFGKVTGYLKKEIHGYGEKPPATTTTTTTGEQQQLVYTGTAIITKKLLGLDVSNQIADAQDDISEMVRGKHVTMQLVSTETDPSTGKALLSKATPIEKWVSTVDTLLAQDLKYTLEFVVPKNFGKPGAIIVNNQHPNEFLLTSLSLQLPDGSKPSFITNSWVYNTSNTEGRIFFSNKAYLPADTPAMLKELRAKELANMRGDGKGERKESDRIYDYATYNDLGDPDKDPKLDRPTLGGNTKYPYPRRMRSGREFTRKNPGAEKRDGEDFYIPRDECFDRNKMSDFSADGVRSILHGVKDKFIAKVTGKPEFDTIAEIKDLYVDKGQDVDSLNNLAPNVDNLDKKEQFPAVFLRELIRPDGILNQPTQYPIPGILRRHENAWQNNDEFSREFLAGLNPVVIALVEKFPIKSKLKEFGFPVSAITTKHIDGKLDGLSVEEAVEKKKLYVADYHDSYLPFLTEINKQDNARSYATRALFVLTKEQTLKVLALELALPPKTQGGPLNARVFLPPTDTSKTDYLWEMAKAHVSNNDITAHQVFSHFTKCHAVTETLIITSNRCLSKVHPIMQLMAPHFKSTLEINRQARKSLINAGGSIETHFTPRAYSMRMGAAHYRDAWTFESQALPNDLVARGMAVRDPSSKHGVKLVIEDYPYAADGLELWTAIKGWNKDYVDIWYKDDGAIRNDVELQTWFTELREQGHADKKDAPGWPPLDCKANLVEILTTMQWIPSCQHAAVNFGQFDYAGFMPHHPTIVRQLIPEEGTKDWIEMMKHPEKAYLLALANRDSTTTAMSVYEVLSSHSPNEEYIGDRPSGWTDNAEALAAFERFQLKIDEVDVLITSRNKDKSLKNRDGVVNMPYQLLRPKSEPGVTSMGVPNSITI